MRIHILQMIPVGIIDSIVINSGIVLQVVAEIIITFHRISRSRKEVGIGMYNHSAENYKQDQDSCTQNGHQGDCVLLHKSIT